MIELGRSMHWGRLGSVGKRRGLGSRKGKQKNEEGSGRVERG